MMFLFRLPKLLLGPVLLIAVLAGVLGADASSFLSTSWDRVARWAQDLIPDDFELDRARSLVETSAANLAQHREAFAAAELKVEELQNEVAGAETRLAVVTRGLRRTASGLGARALPVSHGPAIDAAAIREARDRHDLLQRELDVKRDLLVARQAQLEELRAAVRDASSRRTGLLGRIQLIEVRREAAAARSVLGTESLAPGGELSQVESILRRLERKQEVAERAAAPDLLEAPRPDRLDDHRALVAEILERFGAAGER